VENIESCNYTVVLCGYATCSLILGKECSVEVIEKRLLQKKIFGAEWGK
jgi:hypothetical protein